MPRALKHTVAHGAFRERPVRVWTYIFISDNLAFEANHDKTHPVAFHADRNVQREFRKE